MASQKHVHKYVLRNYGSQQKIRKLYGCALPDCTHFMPTTDAVKGKQTICWECGDEMIMSLDIVSRRTVKPRCLKCRGKVVISVKSPAKKEEKTLDDAVEMLLAMRGGKV